jgi:hypothetical protein
MDVYREKPWTPPGDGRAVVQKYAPPLDRNAWEDLRDVAKLADCDAEVAEVTFRSGKRVLVAWHLRSWGGQPPKPSYTEVEPGEYLAFTAGYLTCLSDKDLAEYYDKEGTA